MVIAVIDSRIDYNHPDLAANVWTNPGNLSTSDGQPLMGGAYGYDLANGDSDPTDDNGTVLA